MERGGASLQGDSDVSTPTRGNSALPTLSHSFTFLDNNLSQVRFTVPEEYTRDPVLTLIHFNEYFINVINGEMSRMNAESVGIHLVFSLNLRREPMQLGEDSQRTHFIHTPRMFITRNTVEQTLDSFQEYVQRHIEDKLSLVEGSGFILDNTKCLDIFISRNVVPQKVGAYIKYPAGVRGKHKIFNPNPVHDVDKNACILQCLAAHKLYKRNCGRNMQRHVDSWRKCQRLIKIPEGGMSTWESIDALERKNELSITVYSLYQNKSLYELSISRIGTTKYNEKVTLLLLKNQHCCLIRDLKGFYESFTRKKRTVIARFL